MSKFKKVYVCSPYMGDVENNVKNAVSFSRYVTLLGAMPITPHIYSTQFLDENIPEERHLGLTMGLDMLSECEELWVFGMENPSAGMQGEIAFAKEHNIPVYDGYQKIAEELVTLYCKQRNILQPSLAAPIFYFAAIGYCEEKIKKLASYDETFRVLIELEQKLQH